MTDPRAVETGKRRRALTRERVLEAAMELADEGGIGSVTMRELGRRLGVEAASLYNHVSGKDDVFEGLTDLVTSEIDTGVDHADWKSAMRRRAVRARGVFKRHPWASALIDSREHMGLAALSYAESVLGVLLGAGFSGRDAANAFLILDSYIYGFERQRASLSLGDDADTTQNAQEVLGAITPDAFPALLQVAGEFAARPYDEDAVFDLGLQMILGGLEELLVGVVPVEEALRADNAPRVG
jgi:AcrR family transcriptional regulator